jgi:hypothetical protein
LLNRCDAELNDAELTVLVDDGVPAPRTVALALEDAVDVLAGADGPPVVLHHGVDHVAEVGLVLGRLGDHEPVISEPVGSPPGTVVRVEGWLEGYLLTGRHGFFSTYEAFAHVIDSMFNKHAKWLDMSRKLPWRAPVSSLNLLITSTVWRQDHNGFTHQDPGFPRCRPQQEPPTCAASTCRLTRTRC